MATGRRPILQSFKEFVVHIVVGALTFISISAVAAVLGIWVHFLESNGVNPMLIKGMVGAEYFLVGIDLFLGFAFVLISTAKLVRALWQS